MARAKKKEDIDNSAVLDLIESGAAILGATTQAAIGLAVDPVTAAGAGAFIGEAFKHVAAELAQRLHGRRERARIGATIGFALTRSAQHDSDGDSIRSDGFFEPIDDDRSPADEVFEGILLAARDSYEEKKLHLLGNLFSNVAFDDRIDSSTANTWSTLAGQLTYRQRVLLAVVSDETLNRQLRNTSYRLFTTRDVTAGSRMDLSLDRDSRSSQQVALGRYLASAKCSCQLH